MGESCSGIQSPASVKTSKLAIASLVFSLTAILVLLFLPKYLSVDTCVLYRLTNRYAVLCASISSVVFAFAAVVGIKRSNSCLRGKGLVIVAIVLSFWAAHRAIILPRVRRISYIVHCAKNLKNLGEAIRIYATYNDGRFPSAPQWCDLLLEHTDVSEEQFICGDSFWPVFSYGFNKNLDGLRIDDVPPDTVMLFEIKGGRNVSGGPELMVDDKHDDFASVVLYVGGHTETIKKEWAKDLKWEVPNKEPE